MEVQWKYGGEHARNDLLGFISVHLALYIYLRFVYCIYLGLKRIFYNFNQHTACSLRINPYV